MKKDTEKGTFAVSRCHKCRKKQPVIITDFVNKDKEKKFTSVHCAVCETVLNVDKDIDIEYVGEAWLRKRGWKPATEIKAARRKSAKAALRQTQHNSPMPQSVNSKTS